METLSFVMQIVCASVSAYLSTFTPAGIVKIVSSFVVNSSACTKCGTTKESGTRSCCARGGAWFEKCGDTGDTKFGHTWAEGIQACTSRS